MICLIPKEQDATVIQKFRPISLVDCCYKIISKILTTRLTDIMDDIVDRSQTAFMKGRIILDNVLVAHEIIHYARVQKQKGILVKIDFEKAYDKINWDFIFQMLISRGFGNKWAGWVISLLQGSKNCVNINGKPSFRLFQLQEGFEAG